MKEKCMFLKKKQENSETDDILQQIKEKISETGNDAGDNKQNGSSNNNSVDGMSGNVYSDDDDDLLNMLLSDDEEDDEEEDELNGLSGGRNHKEDVNVMEKTDDTGTGIHIDANQKENELDDKNIANEDKDNDDDDDLLEEDDDEEVDSEVDASHSNVDDIMNDLKDIVRDELDDKNGIDVSNNKQLVDEDDIEFYDEDGDNYAEDGDGENTDEEDKYREEIEDDEDDGELKGTDEADDDIFKDNAGNDDKTATSNATLHQYHNNNDDAIYKNINNKNNGKVNSSAKKMRKIDVEKEASNVITVNDGIKKSVRKNISNLIEQVKRQVVDESENILSKSSGSKTLEQIAIDLIQPVVIDYLNNNLERIVENIVNDEIKRITDDIDR